MDINKTYEGFETEIVSKSLLKGHNFIDVGANIGYYTVRASKLIGKGKVYSFEPDLTHWKTLQDNIKKKGCKNVTVLNEAAWDEDVHKKFYLNQQNKGDHKLFDDGVHTNWITVHCKPLDTYFRDKRINFIKIDTQGAEVQVLKGLKQTIANNKTLKMLIEYYPYGIRHLGYQSLDLLNLLSVYGFKAWVIYRKTKSLLPLDNNIKFDTEFNNVPGRHHVNLFCIKRGD